MYSYRDDEATELLTRLTGMEENLPDWMKLGCKTNAHTARFGNGSRVRALPTTAGDSYTASIVLVDEADVVPNLNEILRRVKPTIDNGGQLFLVSRSNKDRPDSTFKRIYRGAKEGSNNWKSIFLPWNAHPARDARWYEEQAADIFARTGSYDDLHEQYPATDLDALSARVLSKRISSEWVGACFEDAAEQLDNLPPEVPGLRVWVTPVSGGRYLISVDVAEGKETSDDSAAIVFDANGEQVAQLDGRIEITVFSQYLAALSKWYNGAQIFVERNNHGHAVIERLKDDYKARLMRGRDGRYGYLSDARGKAEMYSALAERFKNKEIKIRSVKALHQILSIERATLRAPEGLLDDLADAAAIGAVGLDRVNVGIGSIESW